MQTCLEVGYWLGIELERPLEIKQYGGQRNSSGRKWMMELKTNVKVQKQYVFEREGRCSLYAKRRTIQ